MTFYLTYEFEELPTLSEQGFEAGFVDGGAEIRYYGDGEWMVGGIHVNAYKNREKKEIELDESSELYLNIFDQLQRGPLADRVQYMVTQSLIEDGHGPKSDRQQHSTHFHSYSGVR